MARVAYPALAACTIAIWAGVAFGGVVDSRTCDSSEPHPCRRQAARRHPWTYRLPPGYRPAPAQIKCSGRTVWVLFHGGAESSQEAYLGVRSGDAGQTWKLLLSEPYFGIKAPFTIDSYSGPWTIVGEKTAYFVGWCPACGYGTVSLTVTLDGGRHFRRYRIPKLTGFLATGIRVVGDDVTIAAKSQLPTGPRRRTVTIEVR